MHFYCTAKLSDKMYKTPEGYLVCQDVAITRVGELQYLPGEMPSIARGDNDIIVVERSEADVFDEDTIRSFEGKPITVHHPKQFVGPHNHRELSVGSLNNVRRGTGDMAGKLVTDFLITDSTAIGKVERRELREVSCGYEAEYIQIKPGRARQTDIRGNHVALVPRGRAGPECAIFDSAPKEIPMTAKAKLLALFSKAVDAMPDDGDEETVDGLKAKLAKFQKDKEDADKKATDAQAVADKATADLKKVNDELATANADKAKLTTDLATVTAEVTALKKPAGKTTNDAAIVAKAEILAPGIAADTQDIQVAALKTAYATTDGKAAIDVFTGGKAPAYDNAAAVDVIFNGAAASIAAVRKAALAGGGGNQTKATDAKTTDFYQDWDTATAKTHPVPKL